MRLRSMAVVMVALGGMALGGSAVRGDVVVSAAISDKDAQADFDAGRYPECLQKIQTLLTSSNRPSGAKRAELLTLKAECMLQQKQVIPATEAFVASSAAHTDDKKAAARDAATAVLIKKTTALQYTPKTGTDKTPISILDRSMRGKALTAFFNDEYATEEQVYKNAIAKTNLLMPVVDFAPTAKELGVLELGATGSVAKTDPMIKALAAHAKTAMENGFAMMHKSADQVATSATTMVDVPNPNAGRGGGRNGGRNRNQKPEQKERGLTESDRTTLQGLIASAEKVPPAVKTLVANLGVTTEYYRPQIAEASALKKRAEAMLSGHLKAK
jgi:hypothetical protein